MRKKLEKDFIFKKSTQRKTLHTLKMDLFQLPDNKIIGKLFSKYELFYLYQANFSSDPSQIGILQFCIPRKLPLLPCHLCQIPTSQLNLLFNAILIMFFIGFPIFVYLIQPHATTIGYTKSFAKLGQWNLLSSNTQIIIPFLLIHASY